MTKLLFAMILTLAPAVFGADAFKLIHVSDLDKMLGTKSQAVYIADANNEKTRTTEGVIPGAHILSSYDKYDLAKELPSDKATKLVFYCASTQCSASHDAAKRAADAGYKDVNVMADGIKGWKAAGKKAEPYKAGHS